MMKKGHLFSSVLVLFSMSFASANTSSLATSLSPRSETPTKVTLSLLSSTLNYNHFGINETIKGKATQVDKKDSLSTVGFALGLDVPLGSRLLTETAISVAGGSGSSLFGEGTSIQTEISQASLMQNLKMKFRISYHLSIQPYMGIGVEAFQVKGLKRVDETEAVQWTQTDVSGTLGVAAVGVRFSDEPRGLFSFIEANQKDGEVQVIETSNNLEKANQSNIKLGIGFLF
jgi:hypothetical protein